MGHTPEDKILSRTRHFHVGSPAAPCRLVSDAHSSQRTAASGSAPARGQRQTDRVERVRRAGGGEPGSGQPRAGLPGLEPARLCGCRGACGARPGLPPVHPSGGPPKPRLGAGFALLPAPGARGGRDDRGGNHGRRLAGPVPHAAGDTPSDRRSATARPPTAARTEPSPHRRCSTRATR